MLFTHLKRKSFEGNKEEMIVTHRDVLRVSLNSLSKV